MASRQVGSYLINQYISDRGEIYENIRGKSVFPPDVDVTLATQIVATAGGSLLRFAGNPVAGAGVDPGSICSDNENVKPRTLTFIRSNGNSISVKVNNRAGVATIATAIRDLIDGINGALPVVCIKLDGEEWINIYEELGGTGAVTATANLPRGTGSKQNVFSGRIPYQTDAPIGDERIMTVKVLSDAPNGPPSFLGGTWNSCVGQFQTVLDCPGREPRDHRRYILTVASTNFGSFNTEVPVVSSDESDIESCGTVLADIESVYCIGYKGESNDRLHKVL